MFGRVDEEKGEIVPFDGPLKITSQCIRVPVLNGHTATVFINFGKNPTKEELVDRLVNYTSKASELGLPHAPKQFIQYLTDDDRPQVKKDVDYEGGMGVSVCARIPFSIGSSWGSLTTLCAALPAALWKAPKC